MRDYIVLAPPLPAKDGAPEALRLVFVKDGFCWPALLITLPWLLYRGLFVEAALTILAMVALGLFAEPLGAAAPALSILLPLAFGVLGNDIRRFALRRRGYRVRGEASGRTLEEAEIRYFHGLPEEDAPPPSAMPVRVAPAAPGAVIGLFPQAEGAR
ncbi:MAG TPA: DUF2628 domain-containing protein [Kaistia sp.]|nr:DUF2628 domain-containing protein [Kaistia sp.]